MFIWGMIAGFGLCVGMIFVLGLCISAKYRDEIPFEEEDE